MDSLLRARHGLRCWDISVNKTKDFGSKELTVLYRTIENKQNKQRALAGVAQWIVCWPVNLRVAGSIPSQGTCLGCRPCPQ